VGEPNSLTSDYASRWLDVCVVGPLCNLEGLPRIDKAEPVGKGKISDGPEFNCLVQNLAIFGVPDWNLRGRLEMPNWHLKSLATIGSV